MANSGLEIVAHAHREPGEASSVGNFGQQREVRPRGLAERRYAHQAFNIEPVVRAADFEKPLGLGRGNARLLKFFARIDLDIKTWAATHRLDLAGEVVGQLWPIEGLNHIKEGDSVADLVGLEGTYKTKFQALTTLSPSRQRLLYAIFAKNALTRAEDWRDGTPGLLLGDGRQPHFRWVSARGFRCSRDACGQSQKGCGGLANGRLH
jgi:hypothetical protein